MSQSGDDTRFLAVATFRSGEQVVSVQGILPGMKWLQLFEKVESEMRWILWHPPRPDEVYIFDFFRVGSKLKPTEFIPVDEEDLIVQVRFKSQRLATFQPLRRGLQLGQRLEVLNLAGDLIPAIVTGMNHKGYRVFTEEDPSRPGAAPFMESKTSSISFHGLYIGCYVQQLHGSTTLSWHARTVTSQHSHLLSEMGLGGGTFFGPVHDIRDSRETCGSVSVLVPRPAALPEDYTGSSHSLLWIYVSAPGLSLCSIVPTGVVRHWESQGWHHRWYDNVDFSSPPEITFQGEHWILVPRRVYIDRSASSGNTGSWVVENAWERRFWKHAVTNFRVLDGNFIQ